MKINKIQRTTTDLAGYSAAVIASFVLNPVKAFAQSPANCSGTECIQEGVDGAGSDQGTDLFGPDSIFSKITDTLLFLVGIISVIMLIIGGIRYIVSGGDQNAVTAAKNTILYAIIGIVVAFLAFAAVRFVTGQLAN